MTASALSAAEVLDALPYVTAVVARDGTILEVNRAWRTVAEANGGTSQATGVGTNYFDVCDRAVARGVAEAAVVKADLLDVFEGATVEREVEYSCAVGSRDRWYVLRITRIESGEVRALLSHIDISRRKLAEQYLQRKASEDPLTGLANRVMFAQRMTSALTLAPKHEARPDIGLMYIDLNGFKPVNDTYGHAAGDEVLQSVAERLRLVTRPQDTVARLGGDEFAVLAPRISVDGLAALVGRVEEILSEPHFVCGVQVLVGASVGTYLATRGETTADALRRADDAMYADKSKHDPAVARLRDTARLAEA